MAEPAPLTRDERRALQKQLVATLKTNRGSIHTTDQTAHAALQAEAMDTTEGPADIPTCIQPFVGGAEATRQWPTLRRSPSPCAQFRKAHGLGTDVVSDNKILHVDPSDCQSHVVFPRVAQSALGIAQDSGFENHTGSGPQQSLHLPTQLQLPPEVDSTGPNPRSTVDSEWTDSIDHRGASRITASRPVQPAARAEATAPVPDKTRTRYPPAPTSTEIRSMLTFLDESSSPRETDVAATPAASTREVSYAASLACVSAPETSMDPFKAAAASVATVDPRARSPACAPAVPALPSAAGTGSRQGRTKDEEREVRFKHVTYCCICYRSPGGQQEVTPTNVEAVFCGTCPRKFCLGCLNLSQTPDTLGWEARFDDLGDFQRIPDGCTNCRRGTDREVPVDVGESHSTAITEVLKVMLQWLGNHDLARFFREDVNLLQFPKYKRRVKKPMSLTKIRDQLKEGYYAVVTEAGMKCFLQDLALIESNCIRFNGKEPGISRSATTLLGRSYLFYHSHIEPLAAKLGFPHMLGENYTCEGRIWVGGSINAAGRGSGDPVVGIDGAIGAIGNRASTTSSRASVAPPTSFRPNLTESWGRVSTLRSSHPQSAGIPSSSVCVSSHVASAGSGSNVDPTADPVTDANDQARNVHILSCYVCGRSPDSQDQRDEEEVVFCRECPRNACLSCHMTSCHMTKEPIADHGEWEHGRDSFGVFWLIPRCRKCLFKAESKAPVELDMPSSVTPAQDLHEYVLKILWNFLGRRNLAKSKINNVARHPMTLTHMLKRLDDGEYEPHRGGPDLFIQDLYLILHDYKASNMEDSVAFRCARIILAHGERIIPMHGRNISAGPEPPRTISDRSEVNTLRDPCGQAESRVSGTTHGRGGAGRDSAAGSRGVRIIRSTGCLSSMSDCPEHTIPDEATSVRELTRADIRREERTEQHDNGDRPGHEGYGIRKALSAPTLQPAEEEATSVRQQAGASAAAESTERPTTLEMSMAALTAGSTRLNPHFETERGQNGTDVRELFSKGHIVWVFQWFGANMPPNGWMEEAMHVPGVIRDEAVGTSPAMFTIDLFGRNPVVLQATVDKLSLFPMEGDLDSARSAVTHGLRPENDRGINYLNLVVAQAMLACVKSGWNSTTGTNIYHTNVSTDESEIDRRTKEYGETWGIDSAKLAQLMQHTLQVTRQQEAIAYGDCSGRDSRVLGAGWGDGIGVADPSVGGSGSDGEDSADVVNDSVVATDGAGGGEAWTQAGRHSSPARQSVSQDPTTTRISALQASADDMLVDAGYTRDNSGVLYSAAEEKTEPPARSPPSDATVARTPTDKRIKLRQRRSRYESPPPFNARDFEDKSMNPSRSNQASLPEYPSLRGR